MATTPIERLMTWVLDSTGATANQIIRWNASTQRWEPSNMNLVAGPNIQINNTDPTAPVISADELLTTEVNGTPDLVWDDDNRLVMTEGR